MASSTKPKGRPACCPGVEHLGPDYCVCWSPMFDQDRQDIRDGKAITRTTFVDHDPSDNHEEAPSE